MYVSRHGLNDERKHSSTVTIENKSIFFSTKLFFLNGGLLTDMAALTGLHYSSGAKLFQAVPVYHDDIWYRIHPVQF